MFLAAAADTAPTTSGLYAQRMDDDEVLTEVFDVLAMPMDEVYARLPPCPVIDLAEWRDQHPSRG